MNGLPNLAQNWSVPNLINVTWIGLACLVNDLSSVILINFGIILANLKRCRSNSVLISDNSS